MALAAPPEPSAVSVSSTQLAPGEEFTVSLEIFNPEAFTVTSANAQLRTVEANLVDLVELVSCTGTVAPCGALTTSFRGPVGDLPGGEGRTVVFTFRVKDGVPAGDFTLEHQFVGGNFAFPAGTGPVATISLATADLEVSLDASPRGILTSRITYTVRVDNLGPGDATGVRIGGTFANGLSWAHGNGCTRPSGRNVQCDFPAIPNGGSATATFSVDAGLLALGTFSTSVSRVAGSPSDPIGSNDSARRSCAALTGLLVRC
ncbi:putative repeat protein (TIGR01451 family) [Actinophytocola oryzae]|uniref:Putative repeat protein (TIGR01451 family) n=1 Tax=Actinophytocola oryzae TaxID=502181 RepID=A0A4V3FQR7_9PSEU|nr:putative repeat protein (TIGR01451 family) [Actinophytocola oryzae]